MEDEIGQRTASHDVIDVNKLSVALEQGTLTKADVKFETPSSRQARETKEAIEAWREWLLNLLKLAFAGILLLGFFGLGVYLFAFKPGATEAQKLYASTVLTAIASGSAGYAFGKKEGKSEKE